MESTDQRVEEPAWSHWVLVLFADKGKTMQPIFKKTQSENKNDKQMKKKTENEKHEKMKKKTKKTINKMMPETIKKRR